ncbi:MAG: hypothetical protein LBG70_02245 [Bifidobacteriaceae bacterium]|nr:hypothetical protein [Bifidobacteriaceae bacterium]
MLAYLADSSPGKLAEQPVLTDVPVVPRLFTDSRQVEVTLTGSPGIALRAHQNGLVTSDQCQVGKTIQSGELAATINGQPIVALSTSIPLWRTLKLGATGKDVLALQNELKRLGKNVEANSHFDKATLTAANALIAQFGGRVNQQNLDYRQLIWLPSTNITIAECLFGLNQQANSDQIWGVAQTQWARASLTSSLANPVPGARVLVVSGERMAISDSQEITDPTDLAALVAAQTALDSPENIGSTSGVTATGAAVTKLKINAQWELAQGLETYSVPARSVVNTAAGACVLTKGSIQAVVIRGVELSQTIISTKNNNALETVSLNAPSESQCASIFVP